MCICVCFVPYWVSSSFQPPRYSRREMEPLKQCLVPRQVARSDRGASLTSRRESTSSCSRKLVGFGRFGHNFDRLWACMDPTAHRAMAGGSIAESL